MRLSHQPNLLDVLLDGHRSDPQLRRGEAELLDVGDVVDAALAVANLAERAIRADPVARPTEQAPHGDAGGLADDVPARRLQVPRPESERARGAAQDLEDVLDLRRVPAGERRSQEVDHALRFVGDQW